jgi:hypothetical protein
MSLVAGLDALQNRVLRGAFDSLKPLCRLLSDAMQADPAHGDVTAASHTNYAAYPVSARLGESGASIVASQVSVVENLNPGHSETEPLSSDAAIVVVVASATDYQWELETENAGAKAVIGPTIAGSSDDFTRAAALGIRNTLQ